MTATWKVYSVIRLGVLLEKEARIDTSESLLPDLDTWKAILIDVFETIRSLAGGREVVSSGKAEENSNRRQPTLHCRLGESSTRVEVVG